MDRMSIWKYPLRQLRKKKSIVTNTKRKYNNYLFLKTEQNNLRLKAL